MKRNVKQYALRGLLFLTALCCLPADNLPVTAADSELPVAYMTEVQNGAHLSPRITLADGTIAEPPVLDTRSVNGIYRASELPSAYSLLDDDGTSYVTSVKNQGSTGLCWAYSALGACESNLLKQGVEIPEYWLDEQGELNFSEGALGWYIFTNHYQDGDFTSGDSIQMENKGVTGGNAAIAGFSLAAGMGTQLEKYAPFSDWDNGYSAYQRYVSYCRMKSSDTIWQVSDSSIDVIKQWIQETGGVSAAFYSADTFYDNDTSKAYYQSRRGADAADHAILLVGWDDDYARENFRPGKQPKHDGAWLVKNSWGDDDAYEGYFWMSYEEASLCEFTRYDMMVAEDSEICYQYDGAVSYAGIGASAAANVFTAEEDGMLTRVMFPNLSGNPMRLDYTVSVYYMDASAKTPEEGELAVTAQGVIDYGGYKGVAVPPVSLKKDERFAVVLQLKAHDSADSKPLLAMESSVTDTKSIVRTCYFQEGQSLIYTGSTWMDVADLVKLPGDNYDFPYQNLGNVAIKAIVQSDAQAANRTQLNEALSYGAPPADACQLYRDAYAEAIGLAEDASQQQVDNAARNLLAGLEQAGKLKYARSIYANYDCTTGDIDGNGKVEMMDAYHTLIASSIRYLGEISDFRPAQVKAADVDEDGTIRMDDAYYILIYSSMRALGLHPQWEDVIGQVSLTK